MKFAYFSFQRSFVTTSHLQGISSHLRRIFLVKMVCLFCLLVLICFCLFAFTVSLNLILSVHFQNNKGSLAKTLLLAGTLPLCTRKRKRRDCQLRGVKRFVLAYRWALVYAANGRRRTKRTVPAPSAQSPQRATSFKP